MLSDVMEVVTVLPKEIQLKIRQDIGTTLLIGMMPELQE